MDIFGITLEQAQQFPAILFRVGAFLFMAPLFGGRNLPNQLKAAMAVVISLLLFLTLPIPKAVFPFDGMILALNLGREILMGGALALAVRIIFASADLAGQLQGYQMGFSIANVIDPQSHEQISVIAQIHNMIAILVFLAIDGHHLILRALIRSFDLIAPFEAHFSSGMTQKLIALFGQLFILAVKIASPVIAALFLSNLALGLIARMVPQMNIFMMSMPLNIGLGLLIFSFSLPFLVEVFSKIFRGLEGDLALMLKVMQ